VYFMLHCVGSFAAIFHTRNASRCISRYAMLVALRHIAYKECYEVYFMLHCVGSLAAYFIQRML